MVNKESSKENEVVAPFTGAWVEIGRTLINPIFIYVAPFTGAWIEIVVEKKAAEIGAVAPFTGAWIEINGDQITIGTGTSLPSRGRGLKFAVQQQPTARIRRSLHGGVD